MTQAGLCGPGNELSRKLSSCQTNEAGLQLDLDLIPAWELGGWSQVILGHGNLTRNRAPLGEAWKVAEKPGSCSWSLKAWVQALHFHILGKQLPVPSFLPSA